MLTYDIRINELNLLEVGVYKATLVHEDKKAYYHFDFVRGIIVDMDTIKDVIWDLQTDNAVSINSFRNGDFSIETSDIIFFWRSLFLASRHQVLEKVAVDVVDNDISYIYTYVTYVNVDNGEIKAVRVGNAGMYSENLKEELSSKGFKNVGESFLGNYMSAINSGSRPFRLERKKDKSSH
ncbi:MAG: hypothetical protein NC483_04410 [Ruminococcus sp.]|nr:hypothetical protein [Ruminococcus sp.]